MSKKQMKDDTTVENEELETVRRIAAMPAAERKAWRRRVLASFRKAESASDIVKRLAALPAEERKTLKRRCMAYFRKAEIRPRLRLIPGGLPSKPSQLKGEFTI